jgi:Signal peptidase, peptidase S26
MADDTHRRPAEHVAPGPTPATGQAGPAPQGIAARIFPRSTPVAGPHPARPAAPKETDSFREVVETIVFVVVLVLLLRSFIAEAFVIPTGSMATTLLGYHIDVPCPQCGHRFSVNASKWADAQEKNRERITGCTCPNCLFHIDLEPAPPLREGEAPP